MKKINKKKVSYIIIALAMLTLVSFVLPVLVRQDVSYVGYQVAFGSTITNVEGFDLGTLVNARLPFNLLALGAYALSIAGGVIIYRNRNHSMWSGILFIASGVLFLIIPNFTPIKFEVFGSVSSASVNWSYGYGLIVSAVSAFTAGLLSLLVNAK